MKVTLKMPVQYRDALLTPEGRAWIAKHTNGCGSGWSTFIVPNRFLIYNIRPACDVHDICYEVGKTQADKQAADDILRDNINRILDAQIPQWRFIERWLADRDAELYHDAVKEFGHDAFWQVKPIPVNQKTVTLVIVDAEVDV
jgi:hypothetical protein